MDVFLSKTCVAGCVPVCRDFLFQCLKNVKHCRRDWNGAWQCTELLFELCNIFELHLCSHTSLWVSLIGLHAWTLTFTCTGPWLISVPSQSVRAEQTEAPSLVWEVNFVPRVYTVEQNQFSLHCLPGLAGFFSPPVPLWNRNSDVDK